jgi:pimeloyl-ACP methyl ester carboxylesterase
VPVLHVHGDADRLVPLDGAGSSGPLGVRLPAARSALSPFLDARLVVLPGVGHRWTRGGPAGPDVTGLAEAFLSERAVLPPPPAAASDPPKSITFSRSPLASHGGPAE